MKRRFSTCTIYYIVKLIVIDSCGVGTIAEAKKIAADELTDYCRRESIDCNGFDLQNPHQQEEPVVGGWSFKYTYRLTPRHDVTISVKKDGSVQLWSSIPPSYARKIDADTYERALNRLTNTKPIR